MLRGFLKTFAAPSRSEIGTEVSFWKQKLAAGPLRPKLREAGSYGQLETTEMVIRSQPAVRKRPAASEPSVVLAHQLDNTQFEIQLARVAAVDGETDPHLVLPEGLQSVILDPQLEAVSERRPGAGRRAKKKRRKPR